MSSLNTVSLTGRLGQDVELRKVGNDMSVTTLRMAVSCAKGETMWLDVECWGKTAEVASQHLCKGREVGIVGRLNVDNWEDKETGKKRTKVKVVANTIHFIGSKQDGSQGSGGEVKSLSADIKSGYSASADQDIPF